jgi:hypothetical protein
LVLTPLVTPHESCARTLALLVTANFKILHELHSSAFNITGVHSFLSYAVALQDADVESLDLTTRDLRTFLLTTSAYTTDHCRTLLEGLLTADQHLRTCCQTPWGLARAIELLIPQSLVAMHSGWDEGGVETAIAQMMASLYEGPFQRAVYIRLYNFYCDSLPLKFPGFNLEVVKLDSGAVAVLLGEVTPFSALHDTNTGMCFLKLDGSAADNEVEAFNTAWAKAHEILTILRYLKYGVIENDYGAIYFSPPWVTQIRRQGISFRGQPRRDKQDSLYVLEAEELPELFRYGLAYEKLKHLINDPKPKTLRMANSLAANFYEGHYRRHKHERDQKLVELVIALEILFSPGESELTFRIAQRAAILLGKNADDRKTLMKFFKVAYAARSQVVHTGKSAFSKDPSKGVKTLSDQQLNDLGDYVRQAVLRVFTLVWRGKQDRDELNALLDESALDERISTKLMADSDFEAAIDEILAPVQPAT